MGTKTAVTDFDDGQATREQAKRYGEGLLPMAVPRSKRPRRAAKVIVWGALGVLVCGMGTSLVLTNANRAMNVELSKTLQTQYNPSFRVRYDGVGAQVINAYFGKQPPPINVDSTVAWPTQANTSVGQLSGAAANAGASGSGTAGSAAVTAATGTQTLAVTGVSFLRGSEIQDRGPGKRYEERLEYYALVNGVPQTIGVTIAIPNLDDLSSDPVLVAAPTITGAPSVSSVQADQSNSPTSTLGGVQLTDAATAALNTWAAAWTSGDPAALKQATHDADPSNTYRGLGSGWEYVGGSAKALWSANAPDAGGNAVARVTFQIQTPATTVQTGSGSAPQTVPGVTQTQTMDVLVGAYKSGSPAILAWGQPGTYLELKPGYNAISKDAAATMAPAPTSSPNSGTSAGNSPSAPTNTGVGSVTRGTAKGGTGNNG